MARKRQVFSVQTPLGHRVVLTRNRWREITRFKHPALVGFERAVRECVRDPERIRASNKDPNVHVYYRAVDERIVCVVVAGDDPQSRFVVTAYFTTTVKRGQDLWTK